MPTKVAIAPTDGVNLPTSPRPAVILDDATTGRRWTYVPPRVDLDAYIGFSFKRCVFSIVGLVLVLTDIPRTGFFMSLREFYPYVGNGILMYWGPYDYPAYHLNATTDGDDEGNTSASQSLSTTRKFFARSGDVSVNEIDVWAYKFDSVSIPKRALATALGVESFPPCILYKGPCAGPTMAIGTAFTMLDDLLSAIQATYFADPDEIRPVQLVTLSNWIDRLHHHIVRWIWLHQELRATTIHHYRYNGSLQLCAARHSTATQRLATGRPELPMFCELSIAWLGDHPIDGPSRRIPIDQQMLVRLELLQRAYPELTLELTILSSHMGLLPRSLRTIPRVHLRTENIEITTLIRGRRRRCPSDDTSTCHSTTVFIDDYRYERAICESDEEMWQHTTRWLRLIAQGYVWLRVVLLWGGCYVARAREAPDAASPSSPMWRAWRTFFKIPGYTIVYGSWLPIVLYTMAHYLDSVVIHLLGEYVWTTVNGSFDFDLFKFLLVASVQMRNIWLLALGWRLMLLAGTWCTRPQQPPWRPRDGVWGVRGLLIGLTSWLTIFSYMRSLYFRDSNVAGFHELPRTAAFYGYGEIGSPIEWGFNLDLKVMALSFTLVTVALGLVQTLLGLVGGRGRQQQQRVNLFVCHSYYVPWSADALWPRSMLGLFWHVARPPPVKIKTLSQPTATTTTTAAANGTSPSSSVQRPNNERPTTVRSGHLSRCQICQPRPWYLSWQSVHGCVRHEHLRRIGRQRPPGITALVRLMNITFMTDPWVLFGLYVLGRPLYLYRTVDANANANDDSQNANTADANTNDSFETDATSANTDANSNGTPSSTAKTKQGTMLLPRRVHEGEANAGGETFELLAIIDSRTVPWHILIDVG